MELLPIQLGGVALIKKKIPFLSSFFGWRNPNWARGKRERPFALFLKF